MIGASVKKEQDEDILQKKVFDAWFENFYAICGWSAENAQFDEVAAFLWVKFMIKLDSDRTHDKIRFDGLPKEICDLKYFKEMLKEYEVVDFEKGKKPDFERMTEFMHKSINGLLTHRNIK